MLFLQNICYKYSILFGSNIIIIDKNKIIITDKTDFK